MSYVSHADLGGQPVPGPIVRDPCEPLFHAAWEARVLALTLAMGATRTWNLDMSRGARETLADYRQLSYYEIWLAALTRLLVANDLATAAEIATGRPLTPAREVAQVLSAGRVAATLARGAPAARVPSAPARYAVGMRVRASGAPGAHHTRLPAYARGHVGLIERLHGAHVYPDTNAHGQGEQPRWLYTVAFPAAELWPGKAGRGDVVSVDAFEPYLEPA